MHHTTVVIPAVLQVLSLVSQLQTVSTAFQDAQGSSSEHQTAATAPTEGPLGGQWQLLWTTEASVHKLVKGQLLGIPVRNIQQEIDLGYAEQTCRVNCSTLAECTLAVHPCTAHAAFRNL